MIDPRTVVAYHEAGHAAAALLCGIPVAEVGLTPGRAGAAGVCRFGPSGFPDSAWSWAAQMTIAAAGPVAAWRVGGTYDPAAEGVNGDFRSIEAFAREAARLAPPGWAHNPFTAAGALFDVPATWAGVIYVADAILGARGLVAGAVAAEAFRLGRASRELAARIRALGPRAALRPPR